MRGRFDTTLVSNTRLGQMQVLLLMFGVLSHLLCRPDPHICVKKLVGGRNPGTKVT